jgi:glycosyltransferase involved in cell wall biosynthesis
MSVSVIIPYKYNLQFLEETIQSFLKQSQKADEIIVVNDHSDDLPEPFIKQYLNEIIFVKNIGQGACDARNTGFKVSTGKYIKYFDSDDVLTRNTLEVQSNLLAKSNKGFVYSPVVRVIKHENTWLQQDAIMYYHKYKSKLPFDKLNIRGFCCGIPQCMIKRELINEIPPWESGLKSRQDVEYIYNLARMEPYPLHENQSCLFYRQHNNQITVGRNSNEQLADDLNHALHKILDTILISGNYSDRFYIESRIFFNLPFCSEFIQKMVLEKSNIYLNISRTYGPIFLRLKNKWGRLKTGSNWDENTGPCTDKKTYEKYLFII